MKKPIGVDADSGLAHSVAGTSATASDVSHAHALMHGDQQKGFGDAVYIGVDKRDEMKSKSAKWRAAAKQEKIKSIQDGAPKDLVIPRERAKAQIRA
jgi:IS5 family transposase